MLVVIFSISQQFKQNSIIRNMSLIRKSSKATFRASVQDFSSAMDQKNGIIYSLQTELQSLRPNQEKFQRVKQELSKAKSKYQLLIRDYERICSNNGERLDLSVRGVQQLRIQAQHLSEELRLKGQALKQAKFTTQQLVDFQNKKEDQTTQCRIKLQEQKNNGDVLKVEEQRTRIQICQIREEVEKGKKENYLTRRQNEQINEKCYKTQSYVRGLIREESNLNQNLSKLQDENQKLDNAISQLSVAVGVNQSTINQKQKDIQQITFNIARKDLEKKKIENEIKQKIKQLSAEKQKAKLLVEQLDQKKHQANQLDSQLQEACAQINFIFTKNHQIQEVNQQLRDDLKVCEKHKENVLKNNRILDGEIEAFKGQSLKTISKLQQPFKNRSNYQQQSYQTSKWGNSSRVTDYETGDFEKRTQRN